MAAAAAQNRAVKYRHMENLWGNLLQWVDGINFNAGPIHICLNPANWADDTAANYTQLSYQASAMNEWIVGWGHDTTQTWAMVPNTVGGGSDSTFIPDHYYRNTGWRVLNVGGGWADSLLAGLFYFITFDQSAHENTNIGSRLLYLP
jgi:hypothetical protein